MKKCCVLLIAMFLCAGFYLTASAQDEGSINLNVKARSKSVELKWSYSGGKINGFFIKRAEGGSFSNLLFVNSSVTTYTDTEVQKGNTYRYVVVARNDDKSEGVKSNEAQVTISASEPKPPVHESSGNNKPDPDRRPAKGAIAVPEDVTAKLDNNAVVIRWKSGDKKAEGYKVYRSTNENPEEFEKIATVAADETLKYTDKEVQKGKTYYYNVEAYAGSKKSDRSKLAVVDMKGAAGSGDTFIGFGLRQQCIIVFSVNFKKGNVFEAAYSYSSGNFSGWNSCGSVTLPPNYAEGEVAVDFAINEADKTEDSIYYMFCFNRKTSSMYVNKKQGMGTWNGWQQVTAVSLTDSECKNSECKIGVSYAMKTFWMFVWNPKTCNMQVAIIDAEDKGKPIGQWKPAPRLELPPNYSDDSFVGFGSKGEKSDFASIAFCFNPEELTIYGSAIPSGSANWQQWVMISNKALPMPPNMESQSGRPSRMERSDSQDDEEKPNRSNKRNKFNRPGRNDE